MKQCASTDMYIDGWAGALAAPVSLCLRLLTSTWCRALRAALTITGRSKTRWSYFEPKQAGAKAALGVISLTLPLCC